MKILRYSGWDGTQPPFSLRKREILDHFMENIMKGMSPSMSLAQMMWEGFPLAGMDFRVMGLEEMIEALQAQKEDLFATYLEDLKSLLDDEAIMRRERGTEPPPSFDQLPPGVLEKLRTRYAFSFRFI